METPTQPSQTPKPQSILNPAQPVMKKIAQPGSKKKLYMGLAAVIIVLAGIGTGWKLSGAQVPGQSGTQQVAPGAKKSATEAGVSDESTFSDTAEGVLEEGGIDGEGTHHLVRSADTSKNVYLGSTVIDLESFVGKKVQVWGQTISGKKAGWLMDVGKIKVLE